MVVADISVTDLDPLVLRCRGHLAIYNRKPCVDIVTLVLDQRQQRCQLEGRTRALTFVGIVLDLGIHTRRHLRKVRHSQDLPCRDLHDNRRTPYGMVGNHILSQRHIRNLLNPPVERQNHIQTVDTCTVGNRIVRSHIGREAGRYALTRLYAVAAAQQRIHHLFDSELVLAPRGDLAHRTFGNAAQRIDTHVVLDKPVGGRHVRQERISLQLEPLDIVNHAREELDGRMTAAVAPLVTRPPGIVRTEYPTEIVTTITLGAEIATQKQRQRIGVLAEHLHRIEPLGSEVELHLITGQGGYDGFAAAHEYVAATCRNGLRGQDAFGEHLGKGRRFGARKLYAHQPHNNHHRQ